MKVFVEHIRGKFAFTERRACGLLLIPVSSYHYRPRQNDRSRERLIALARGKPRFGYRRLHVLLGHEGEQVLYAALRRYLQGMGRVRSVTVALVSANLVNSAGNWALIKASLAPKLDARNGTARGLHLNAV